VWQKLKDEEENIECILGISHYPEKKEWGILWQSSRGHPQRMLRSRFNNIISEYKTGQKPLPQI